MSVLSVNCNDRNNAINGLLVRVTIRKVVLLDILSQMVQKVRFYYAAAAILAAILVAIFDFSVSSRIVACYPP